MRENEKTYKLLEPKEFQQILFKNDNFLKLAGDK